MRNPSGKANSNYRHGGSRTKLYTAGSLKQASPIPKGEGRKLRRARNVVKKWKSERGASSLGHVVAGEIHAEIHAQRYERACALILAERLRNS